MKITKKTCLGEVDYEEKKCNVDCTLFMLSEAVDTCELKLFRSSEDVCGGKFYSVLYSL